MDERTPFTDEQMEELPDYLRDLVQGARLQEQDREVDTDDGYTDIFEY